MALRTQSIDLGDQWELIQDGPASIELTVRKTRGHVFLAINDGTTPDDPEAIHLTGERRFFNSMWAIFFLPVPLAGR